MVAAVPRGSARPGEALALFVHPFQTHATRQGGGRQAQAAAGEAAEAQAVRRSRGGSTARRSAQPWRRCSAGYAGACSSVPRYALVRRIHQQTVPGKTPGIKVQHLHQSHI
jgi:hypothetical protein